MTAVGTRSAAGGAASLLRVLPLAGASFAAGTGDMVIAGILPALAAGLRVSETAAGQLVTAYAVAYGCGTVLVAALTGGMPRRRVVTWGLAAFTVVNAAAAVVSSFGVLLVLRVLAGLAAAACTPAAVAIAAEVAPEERRGRYLALVTGGLTVALVAGVPAGTWLGGEYGWRSTMVFVALLGAVSLAGAAGVPFMPAPPSLGLRRRLAPLAVPAVARLLAATVVSGIGGMMMLTYLFPVLREAGGVGHQQMTALFTLYGVAGTAAAWLGGRGADRWGPSDAGGGAGRLRGDVVGRRGADDGRGRAIGGARRGGRAARARRLGDQPAAAVDDVRLRPRRRRRGDGARHCRVVHGRFLGWGDGRDSPRWMGTRGHPAGRWCAPARGRAADPPPGVVLTAFPCVTRRASRPRTAPTSLWVPIDRRPAKAEQCPDRLRRAIGFVWTEASCSPGGVRRRASRPTDRTTAVLRGGDRKTKKPTP